MNNYERLDLYPHNIEASKKIKKAFSEGETTVSIVHATGTGKSYNALALALDHKDEKIIWIVPTNAIKEHIETTINSNPNLNMQADFSNLEIRTYQSFINMTKEEIASIPCDLLIVDEIHHLGAPIWGERISTLIKTHENIKTFGMTAYTVRDRGTIYERDVTNPETDEIFSDSVESVYDLYDALIDGVLPKPIVKSVVTEDSELIIEIKEKIEMLKRKGDSSYLEYEKMLNDVVKMIHKQNGVKELIQQTVIPSGKYIYFCPLNTEEGKNDMNSIMDTMMKYLKEKYPNQRIIFYKTTSASKEEGKHNRYCFYKDIDLEGNDCKDAIKIMFAKNQYNEGVHAPGVDGVFLGRRTRSDIVAFEQIGRALSVRGNINKMVEEYNKHNIDYLKQLAISRGITIKENDTKERIIEKLVSPIIIDLADNIEFIEELETNLGDRVREISKQGPGNKRIIKIIDTSFDIQIINKDLLNILKKLSDKLKNKTWNDWYDLAKIYYKHHGNTEIPYKFKTKNGYEDDEEGVALGQWCAIQRKRQKHLSKEQQMKLESIGFRFENKYTKIGWEEWYKLAKAYYEHYDNTEIPQRFKTKNGYEYDEEGVALGRWCSTQRTEQEKLTKERREKLESIGFRFENKYTIIGWEEMYKLAKAYYEHYDNTEIPQSFKTKNGYEYDEEGVALGKWCNNQRTKQEKLTKERREKLESIGFRFGNKFTKIGWEERYKLAKAYYEHHNNPEIPTSFKTKNGYEYDEEGVSLGMWCATQRVNQENLTPERRSKLELIGFRFIKKKEHSDKIKEICNKYNLDYRKYKIFNNISYQELYAKIKFLLENKEPLQTKEGLNPIFNMSNINMREKYGITKEELITKYYLNKKGRGK